MLIASVSTWLWAWDAIGRKEGKLLGFQFISTEYLYCLGSGVWLIRNNVRIQGLSTTYQMHYTCLTQTVWTPFLCVKAQLLFFLYIASSPARLGSRS